MTDRHTVNATTKQKREEEGGEDKSEINTAVRRSLNSSLKQAIVTNYFLKQRQLCKKNVKQLM
jgi:hypothetical protein